MNAINNGGPAFPQPGVYDHSRDQVNSAGAYGCDTGMSLRDKFAESALAAIISSQYSWDAMGYAPANGLSVMENNVRCAYQYADAMLVQREKEAM